MTTILDRRAGQALKEQGMQLALAFSGPWQDLMLGELREWIAEQKRLGIREITIEQFRAAAKTQPIDHHAWGSAPRMAMRAGLIRPTDRYVRAAAVKTRSHPVRVYELA